MKRTIVLLSLLMIVAHYSFSQSVTVNDIPIKNIDVEYIQIVGTSKLMSNKVSIEIDFGQENKYWSNKNTVVKDGDGKKMDFNSMIDALNFMNQNGYEFVQAYAFSVNNQNVYHYLIRKLTRKFLMSLTTFINLFFWDIKH